LVAKILVVGSNPDVQAFIRRALRGASHDLKVVGSAEEALTFLGEGPPDLVILDMQLPNGDAESTLKVFGRERRYDAVPVLLLSEELSVEARIQGLDLGGSDYLEMPVDEGELAARVRAHLRLKVRYDEIFAEYRRLSHQSVTDALTGALNRHALEGLLEERLAESARYEIPVSCVMFDLDHFKKVNDTYGHATGDVVLRGVADLARQHFRREDSLVRFGGEEFLAILFHAPRSGARSFSERLRECIESEGFEPVEEGQEPFRVTVSLGVASYPEDPGITDVVSFIELADRRLYEAKRAGRNRVVAE